QQDHGVRGHVFKPYGRRHGGGDAWQFLQELRCQQGRWMGGVVRWKRRGDRGLQGTLEDRHPRVRCHRRGRPQDGGGHGEDARHTYGQTLAGGRDDRHHAGGIQLGSFRRHSVCGAGAP
ncbi:MAG: hypothetical protein ACK53Y_02550, partial [bacterium]